MGDTQTTVVAFWTLLQSMMSNLAKVNLLYLLPVLCFSSYGDICHHPEGVNGEVFIEGCVKHTCKNGVWRPSIDKSTCCFNGAAFEFGKTITVLEDDDTATYLECTQDGIVISISRSGDSSPAKKIQVEEIKDLLTHYIGKTDESGCSNQISSGQEQGNILLIGPAYPGNVQSEVFKLPSFNRSTCVPPEFPFPDYHGYVGTNTPDGPLLCGGTHRWSRLSACFIIDKTGAWVNAGHEMSARRFGAASVQTESGWWVTGGDPDESFQRLISTEVWDGTSWRDGEPLPTPLHGHCMTRINTTHTFLVGGATNYGRTSAAYIYSDFTGWVQMESMRVSRYWHACGLHDRKLVIVAGGYDTDMGHTTEYFDLDTLEWYYGPRVEDDMDGGEIFNWGGKTFWIGKKSIWQLVTDSELNLERESWFWRKVAEMTKGGQSSQAFILEEGFCRDW